MICKHCSGSISHQGKSFCSLRCSTAFRNRTVMESRIAIYEKTPSICQNSKCGKFLPYDKRKNKFCSNSCAAIINNMDNRKRGPNPKESCPFSRVSFLVCDITGKLYISRNKDGSIRKRSPYIDKSDIENYYDACRFRFNVYNFPDEFDLSLIDDRGWYSTPGSRKGIKNLEGISRDHIISKRYGYENGIDPSMISHPANCRLIGHRENKKKGTVPLITKEELIIRIRNWDQKYPDWKRSQ